METKLVSGLTLLALVSMGVWRVWSVGERRAVSLPLAQ